ncbi:MAG: TrkA C-terminal domain-containing protein, partial [Rhodoferax sp.]|nr:TrkA C-terminal domain-containing protein [Rhodoferax sp.]
EHLKEAEARLGAPLHDFDAAAPAGDAAPTLDLVAAQLVVTPQSPLVGRTVRGERLQEKYQLTLIGLRKARDSAERQPRENLADVRVEPGDVLLLQGHADAMRLLQRDGVALMLDERLALPRRRKSPVALLTLAGVVLAAGVGGMPIALAAMVGVLVLLVTRTLAWQEIG